MNDSQQQLTILQTFTADLHRAAGVNDAVSRILSVMTKQLGIARAAVGLVAPDEPVVTDWLVQIRTAVSKQTAVSPQATPHPYKLPLDEANGAVATAVLQKTTILSAHQPLLPNNAFKQLHFAPAIVVPMVWGVQAVGVLLLESAPLEETRLRTVEAIAQQTAVAIGMMQTRLRRAKATALKEERARIALDIHDNISQLLFGLQLTLEGSLKLLDTDPASARTELQWALDAAQRVRQQIQKTIHDNWTDEMSDRIFETDLQKYVVDVLQANHLDVVFDIRGDFSALSPPAQRTLYRISQECLTNIAHHAAAANARVCVDIYNQQARLVVRDDGRGFDPTIALTQGHGQEHFGLRTMQERTRLLGGTCDIFSAPQAGTSIVVEFPI